MVFAVVAKKGSFTQAAEDLGITKSAVSQQVSLLENEIGARVLNRTTRGVSLTALGEKLFLHCQLLQDQVEQIFTDIVNAGIDPKGRFAVTFPHSLESNVVLPAIEQLCIEYTGLKPELIVSDSTMDLIANKLDVAIHVGELPDSSYRALPVGTITELFCATPLYLNRIGIPQTLESLCEHRWISTSWQHRNMAVTHKDNNEKSMINLNRFVHVNTLPSALEMALRHMGIVLLPDVIARPLFRTGELVHIVDNVVGPLWPVYTLHAYQADKPVHITRFHQLISRFFSGL
jgi:DNA-binding transcriptional LysR family regulator